jgi:tripartite-type tricarboxylate transporter receptor subunit TctC
MSWQSLFNRLITGGALATLAAGVAAQSFPSRPIRIIVPFPPGGTTDIAARIAAAKMTENMGQTVVVENRAGAGGQLGAEVVAKAAPDGYTLVMHNTTFALASVAAQLAKRPLYNIDTDFAGVSIVVNVPTVMLAHPGVPGKDLKEIGELLARDKSRTYSYGSTGPGSSGHVAYEIFARQLKLELTHIPYKGAAPAKQELIAGRIQLGGDQLSSSLAEIRAGTLKAVATRGSKRSAAIPDVPTVRELGFPEMEVEGFNGLFAPAKTPREIIDRLQREVAAAVKDPATAKKLIDLAAEPSGSSPAEQDAVLRQQVEQARRIVPMLKLE